MDKQINDTEQSQPHAHAMRFVMAQLRTRPWWGYCCVCVGGMFALVGFSGLFFGITGLDLSWLEDIFGMLLTLGLILCLACTIASRFVREEVPNNRPLLRVGGLLALGGFACIFLSLLFPAVDAARTAAAANTLEVQTFAGGRGSIKVPGNWKRNDQLSEQLRALIMSDIDKNLYLSVSGVMRVDSVASKFDQYSATATTKFSTQLSQPKVVERRQSMSGRFEFNEIQIDCVMDDIKARHVLRHIDCGDLWVEARMWGPVSAMQENLQFAQQVFYSIEPVKK